MLAKVSQRYGLGRVVAVDPHNFNSAELQGLRTAPDTSTFDEFSANILSAGVADFVDARRQYSTGVSKDWKSPIRFLWIDGDHSHLGANSLAQYAYSSSRFCDQITLAPRALLGRSDGRNSAQMTGPCFRISGPRSNGWLRR
jgi:hypothetical protein